MKMLFFSSEREELEEVRKKIIEAGIPCEVHEGDTTDGVLPHPCDAELWIQNDGDAYRALMLCVELGVGFARRAGQKQAECWSDLLAPEVKH
jgi:hypothetical protein